MIPFNSFSTTLFITVSQVLCIAPGTCRYEINGFWIKNYKRRQKGKEGGKEGGKGRRKKRGKEGSMCCQLGGGNMGQASKKGTFELALKNK